MTRPTTHAPPPARSSSPLFAEARRLDARIRAQALCRRRDLAGIAFDLLEVKRLELHRLLGYSSIAAYARDAADLGESKTSELLKIARRCHELPRIREAFLSGRLCWSAAKHVVDVATPEDEEEWLRKADRLTVDQLKAAAGGQAPRFRQSVEWTGTELAWVDDAVRAERRAGGPSGLGPALAEICRRSLSGNPADRPGGPASRVVYYVCRECGRATRETSRGPVPVDPEEVEQALCDAEVLDIRGGPAKVTRTLPKAVRDYVEARDGGRCQVPGCRNRAHVEPDHLDGWRSGHDPQRIVSLCFQHHRDRHRGFLRVEGTEPEFRFYLADGTFLGVAGARERVVTPGEFACANSPGPPTSEQTRRDAVLALRKLELRAGEAETLVDRVLACQPGRVWDAGELVGEALRTLP